MSLESDKARSKDVAESIEELKGKEISFAEKALFGGGLDPVEEEKLAVVRAKRKALEEILTERMRKKVRERMAKP